MTLRTAIGDVLFRVPQGVRDQLPRHVRDAIRRRVGPFAPWEAGFPREARALQTGEMTGSPDFVGIGAQRSGTSWWFGLVVAHPDVSHRATIHKERHFFTPFATRAFGLEDIENYHRWFPRPEGTITGEWTPDYVYQPWVPPLLARAAPEAKILMLVRDPVERFLSGLAHPRMTRSSPLGDVLSEAVTRGFYASALRTWFDYFDSHQILVLQYEACAEDPVPQLRRTYLFLGLDADFVPTDLSQRVSPTLGEKSSLDPDARRRLAALYSEDVDLLCRLVPDLELSRWPNFR